jgi:hypothetical protein
MHTTYTFLTIDQWIEANPDIKAEQDECIECEGTGEHHCECGDEHDCGYCNGTGFSEGKSLPEMFREQLAKDIDRLKDYLKRIKVNSLEDDLIYFDEMHQTLRKQSSYWKPKKAEQTQ